MTAPQGWRNEPALHTGASAALAVEAACRSLADLPPLNSAQFAFFAPTTAELGVVVRQIHRSRSLVTATVGITANRSLALTAFLSFSIDRDNLRPVPRLTRPDVASPDACRQAQALIELPQFSANLDLRIADGPGPGSDADPTEIVAWTRLMWSEPACNAAYSMLLADSISPALTTSARDPSSSRTMHWTVDILNQAPATDWHLLRLTSGRCRGTSAIRSIELWSQSGKPVMLGRKILKSQFPE